MSERKLVTVRTIDDVLEHPNADKLEIYVIGGWRIVDRKGVYKSGDNVFYAEVDSMISVDNPDFSFLSSRSLKVKDGKSYHRLKTVKLRGEVSQGLIFPLEFLIICMEIMMRNGILI